ncbi:hypothetical protein ACOMHN_003045 [Nucella lapillus]
MTSYQVMCSVLRPPDPTSQCQIREFQDKVQHHLDAVFQDLNLTQGSTSSSGSSSGGGGGGGVGSHLQHGAGDHGSSGGSDSGAGPPGHVLPQSAAAEDNLMLCAVVSKTSASFSGSDSFKSRVRLPFFWCNWCPFHTESKASLLQHLVSQHCFLCRFCPYTAMSRFHIISHGLKHHPQFSQFREQRLRACHLKRDLFQLHFDPRSESQPDRKQVGWNDDHSDEGPSSPKRSRREPTKSPSVTEDEERLQDQESSSESVDEPPLPFSQGNLLQQGASHLPSTLSTATHVMENVVSSSGMELDTGTDQKLTPKSRQAETCLSPAPSTPLLSEDKKTYEPLHISAVKEEGRSDDADFAHALGNKPTESPSETREVWKGDGHSTPTCDGSSFRVKQEPVDGSPPAMADMDSLYQHDSLQGNILSRSVSSPPLSNIKVENLQRQFEESFGVHPVALTSSVASEFLHTEPHPVHLFAQPSRLASQELVENFLIDPSKSTPSFTDSKSGVEWNNDRSSPSMLRQLLTRPLHKSSACQSGANGGEAYLTEQEDQQSHESDRLEKDTDNASATQVLDNSSATQVLDNFLLTSEKEQRLQNIQTVQRSASGKTKDSELSDTKNGILSPPDARSSENVSPFIKPEPEDSARSSENMSPFIKPDPEDSARSSENVSPFIKPEPEDSAEDYSTGLNLMASAVPALKLTNSPSILPQQDIPSVPHDSNPSPQNVLLSSVFKQENSWGSQSAEDCGQTTSLQTIPPAETLKTFSNMSLRDLLTMDTRSSLTSDKGQATESGDGDRQCDSAGPVAGSVVWECGFCHFEHRNKAVVLAHRQEHHAHLMEEGAMQGSPGQELCESRAASSVDDEEKLSHDEEDHVSWRDQPSTSTGYQSISQIFSSFPPTAASQPGGLMYKRRQRIRGFRRDEDFDYLSASTVESESDVEPDNLEDETYEPPNNLDISDTNLSSEEEGSVENMKNNAVWGDKLRTKKHLSKKKNIGKESYPKKGTHIKSGGSNMTKESLDGPERGKELTELYRCMSCRRQPLPLSAIKDHIRYAPDSRHLLMVRPLDDPACFHFVCPGTKCGDGNTALFPECQSYLVHVLQCQGHIFDVLKSAVHTTALTLLNKWKDPAAILDCPIDNCQYVSSSRGHMWAHMDDHLNHLHTSQMLLFRSVCTVMAKMYGKVDGFDRYICYRCSSILIDLPRVIQHMLLDHRGQVRGVLIVTQKTESRSQGIVVAIQCLKCFLRVPSLLLWFTHKCQVMSRNLVKDATEPHPTTDSTRSSDRVKAYNPDPSIPPFEEWIWGQQGSKMKNSTSATSAGTTSQADTAPQDQLPIIRSILLSDPPNKKREGRRDLKVGSQVTDRKELEKEEEEEVTAMVQCTVCQQFVAENSLSQHGCDEGAQTVTVKREKDNDMQGASPSNASSSKQQQPFFSGDANISHSKLLAALATRHHNNPSGPQTRLTFSSPAPAPRSQPASTSHPSLISLLTQNNTATLKQTASQQSHIASSHLTQKPNFLREHLLKLQLMQSESPAPVQEKSQTSEESVPAGGQTVPSILSQVLAQNLKDSQPKSWHQFFSGAQDADGNPVKSAGAASSKRPDAPGAVPSQPGKEALIIRGQQQQQTRPAAVVTLTGGAEGNVPTGKRNEDPQQGSTSSGHPQLMTFLCQQGDQVRQVLGNILDDQGESSQS